PSPEVSLWRQVHAGGRPLCADLLRALDDHGPGDVPQAQGDGRPALPRRPGHHDPARRCARIPPRRRRAEDTPLGSGADRSSAVRPGQGTTQPTDGTTDVNGGRSGVGIATAAGKAAFWDIVGAPAGTPKVIACEGEFAMTEGHAQELKTQALAFQVGKRLRVFLSDNNAG